MEQMQIFLEVAAALNKAGVEYVLVGGYAVILHGLPRFTEDVDLFVRESSTNIALLRRALDTVFHDTSLEEITVQEIETYPVIRYASPDGFYIDIIGHLGDAFTIDDLAYEVIDVAGQPVKVATIETLIRMKSDTVRPRDRHDAEFLARLLAEKG